LQGAVGIVSNVSWSQNDAYVAVSTDTGRVVVWNIRTRQPLLATSVGAAITSLALSPDGTSLAVETAQQAIQIWDTATGTRQLTYRDSNDSTYLGPDWSQDGRHLLSLNKDASAQHETLRIWDTTNGRTLADIPIAMDSGWLLSPDGRYVATEDPDKGSVRIWDTQTGHAIASPAGSLPFGALPAWSPDSRELATVRGDNAVQIWNVQTGQTIYTYQGSRESVMEVSWSPDGQKLAILTTLLTYGLFDFQHTSATLHGSSLTVWRAPH
jgi:WD40 repeat protein